jgi:hypothetical protein
MKRSSFRLRIFLLVIIVLSGCTLQQSNPISDSDIVATKVAATLAGLTQSALLTPATAPASATPILPTGTQTATLTPSATIGFTPTVTVTPHPTLTVRPTPSPTPGLGTIAGSIVGYPYGAVPALAIVAFEQEPPYNYWYWITGTGNTYFSMDGYITTGHYQVVAYDSTGNTGGCPVIVQVVTNQTVTCDISNWGSGYPSKPSIVPNP